MKKKLKIPDRRSRHGREMFLLLLSGVLLFQWGKIDAFAAAKEIKTVNIRVTSKLEAGSKLPDIKLETTTVSDGEVAVDTSGGKYSVSEAEWTDKSSNELKAAEEPQMKVTLEPEDVSEDYFVSSYKKANVKISGGTFVSARRDGDELVVTLRVKGSKETMLLRKMPGGMKKAWDRLNGKSRITHPVITKCSFTEEKRKFTASPRPVQLSIIFIHI